MRPGFGGLWRHPDFVRLWAGQTVSHFGSFIGWVALQFTAVLWLHASPLQVSVLTLCQLVPGFLGGVVAGVWVDRRRRRPILIVADIGRALALATIPLAALFDALRIEQLYAVTVVTSALSIFFDVAYEAYLPSLLRREQLVEGNSRLAASASVAELGGFTLGGWLVQLLGGPVAILADALSFVWSAWWVGRIHAAEPAPVAPREHRSFWREAGEGARVVGRSPVLRALAGANVIVQCSNRIVGTVILLYLTREVGFGPGALGGIFAVGGLTSLAGAMLAGRSRRRGGLGPAMTVALAGCGAGVLFIGLARSVSAAGIAFLVLNQVLTDPSWAFYTVNQVSLRQAVTPGRLQGRMNASMRILDFGAMLLGTLGAGVLGQAVGLRVTLWVAASGMFAAAVWLWASPVFRLHAIPMGERVEAPAEPV